MDADWLVMRAPRSRVLFVIFGSAGDLFPALQAVQWLERVGISCRVATTRTLSLYLRSLGRDVFALGDGSEMRALADDRLQTPRFDGWTSWRELCTRYITPTLSDDVARLERVVDLWRPDVVVTCGWNPAGRIIAARHSLAAIELSLAPQRSMIPPGSRFAARYLDEVSSLLPSRDVEGMKLHNVAWGEPSGVMFHDRVLLGDNYPDLDPVGYPYWDAVPAASEDLDAATRFMRRGACVVVTLGSFLGIEFGERLSSTAAAASSLGFGVVVAGGRRSGVAHRLSDDDAVLPIGYVPLSRLLPQASALIHHGGLGTTIAAMRHGVPSVVTPVAFDQSFNARLVEQGGYGVVVRDDAVRSALEFVVADDLMPTRCLEAGLRMQPADVALGRLDEAVRIATRQG